MTIEQGKPQPPPVEKGLDKMNKTGSSIERVSSAPSTVRSAAMRFAIQRSAAPITPANQPALELYIEGMFASAQKTLPQRGATSIPGLSAPHLTDLWQDGERIVKRASELVGVRLANAWATELGRPKRGMRADPQIVNVIFPALEKEGGANAEIIRVLTTSPVRIGNLHRNRIAEGVARYVEFLKFGRETREDDAAVAALIEAWRLPANAAAAATLADTRPMQQAEIDRAATLDLGQERFMKLVKKYPEIQMELKATEKAIYVQHLGSWWGRRKVRHFNPRSPIGDIDHKIRMIKARKKAQLKEQGGGFLRRKDAEIDERKRNKDISRGEARINPRALTILQQGWGTSEEGKRKLEEYKRIAGKVLRGGGLLGMSKEERAIFNEAQRILDAAAQTARGEREERGRAGQHRQVESSPQQRRLPTPEPRPESGLDDDERQRLIAEAERLSRGES